MIVDLLNEEKKLLHRCCNTKPLHPHVGLRKKVLYIPDVKNLFYSPSHIPAADPYE
jgi:hypothetical protein